MTYGLARSAFCFGLAMCLGCGGSGNNVDPGKKVKTDAGNNNVDSAVASGDMAIGPLGSTAFLPSAPWYQDYTSAGTASDSTAIIGGLSGWGTLKVDVSFAIEDADSSVARRTYTTNSSYYTPDCDLASVPVPPGGAIEAYPANGYACNGGGDCHLLVFQGTRLYELLSANISGGAYNGTPFTGGCLAIWDLTHDYWAAGATPYSRGDQCTSADAAGFPITTLLLTAADLSSGTINHALRFTLPNSLIRDSSYVHPATHGTGSSAGGASGGASTMPYGSHLRLKPGTYSGLDANGQIIAKALQTHGMYMADGGDLYISGTSDLIGVVDNSVVSSLKASDFEVLDSGTPVTYTGDCTRTQITN